MENSHGYGIQKENVKEAGCLLFSLHIHPSWSTFHLCTFNRDTQNLFLYFMRNISANTTADPQAQRQELPGSGGDQGELGDTALIKEAVISQFKAVAECKNMGQLFPFLLMFQMKLEIWAF